MACTGMLSQLGVAHFAKKYPAVLDAVLRGVLELTCKYQRSITEYVYCSLLHSPLILE